MKKIILNTLLAVLIFGTTATYAETNVATTTRRVEKPNQGLMQRVKGLFENKKNNTEERRETRIASSTKRKLDRRFEKMAKKYLATIEREEAIMEKIISRIEKIKTLNGATTGAERLVAEAKIKLAEAKTAYERLVVLATNADTAEELTKEALENMKNSTKAVEKLLREVHNLLQKSVGSLRGVSQLRNASSTKER